MLIVLESVGSIFDTQNGVIYPQNADGSYDKDFSISIDEEEVSLEWWESLSPEDFQIVKYGVSTESHETIK
jgi:hypothetical protein|tara:strand:- start:2048 stop:2260 length:213 start_codon:yes stop_codon:yes gene_type:complete